MASPKRFADQTKGRTLDHAAGLYDLLSPLVSFGREQRIHGEAITQLKLPPDGRILDVGCATGQLTRQVAQAQPTPADVVGIDAASRMIDRARRRHGGQPNLHFQTALAENLPFDDLSFDRALATFFFHHVDAGLKRTCLDELHRVLRPGGRLVVVDVDVPTNWFGGFCAWSGYLLFHQDEIRENIRGVLREAFTASPFTAWEQTAHDCGYISTFVLEK